jgi:glycosyltransferase involved in cell wall biosynthesis
MRIALVVPGGVDRSGTERVIPCILWLIEGLVRAEHDVQVFAMRQEARPGQWELLGARVHNIGGRFTVPRTVAALLRQHRRTPFDALHGFWLDSGGLAAAIAGKMIGVPAILTLAGGELEAIRDIGYGARLHWRGRLFTRIAATLASRVTAPSHDVCSHAAAHGIQAQYLPLGVALDRWPPSAPQTRDAAAPIRLLHVGSLNRVKDQHMLLRAARALADKGLGFQLTIIGEDTLNHAIQDFAGSLQLGELVHFAGFLPHAALRPWVERSDLLLVTSRHEAGPLVTLEAAVAGVPTVGTVVGNIADFAAEGAAMAVPVGDHAALAEAVAALARDEPHRLALADAAQRHALACNAERTVAEYCALYAGRHAPLPDIGACKGLADQPAIARR